ncbi:MAG: folate-binding protein [Candidatus Sulfotelmatobacter sp.]
MGSTPLFDVLASETQQQRSSLISAEYRGATTAARFGDPQKEFSALLSGCGIYDLGFRARISITGNDRVRWLNGMVTNNIRDLAAGHGVYAFLLNPQGRILGDMYVFNAGELLIVETDRSQMEKIVATFDHYIIMDDVVLTDISDKQTAIGLMGPKAGAVLKSAGIEIPEMQALEVVTPQCSCDCECAECIVVRGDNPLFESYDVWLAPDDVCKTWQALTDAGAVPAGAEALEMQRIAAGVPLYGVDIRERDLPQETEQARALNFNKGCYVGQEIVERIRSRGNVHRKFTGFFAEADAKISAGAKLSADGKEVGETTSVATLRTAGRERQIALGYIRREIGVPGREVAIGETKASVVQLPLDVRELKHVDEAVLYQL